MLCMQLKIVTKSKSESKHACDQRSYRKYRKNVINVMYATQISNKKQI